MKLIMENWRGFLSEESYKNLGGQSQMIKVGSVRIDIEDLDLEPTKHGEERRHRHKKGGRGSKM